MSEGTTYWGVVCRTCKAPVAFDTRPYNQSGLGSANSKPGAIRCGHGHNHIYFPRDFHFFPCATVITAVTMQENRAAHAAINRSTGPASYSPETLAPRAVRTEASAPDARREAAQEAARIRWATWASKKAM
jgi:hypothetical protein